MTKFHVSRFDVLFPGWCDADETIYIFVARIPFLAHALCIVGLIEDRRYQHHQSSVFHKVHYLIAFKRLPFSNWRVEGVYSSFMVTNFTRQQALACPKECNRILHLEGILLIAIPDLGHWIRTYALNLQKIDYCSDVIFMVGEK
jgi:hypothetical protein